MSRTYRDPIHQEIFLDSKDAIENTLIELIDSQEMQRMRWIKQLGTAWFTFHGAEATRFQHSLGAMYIAKLMMEKFQKDLSLDQDTYQEYKALVLFAALLHDVGHAPFSHSSEDITGVKHEFWTQKIIKDSSTEINQILEKFQEGISEKVCQVLSKSYPVKFLSGIVNSQTDCDRFDYLLRDSYFTGTAYGNFDLNRVIASLTVDLENDCLVVVGEKGMLAVEDYLYARYSMYLQVYQHKKCLASDSLLLKLFERVKLLTRNRRISFLDDAVYKWIMQPETMSVEEYLELDDPNIIKHMKAWMKEKDIILRDLATRFLKRKLFKAQRINKGDNLEEIYKKKSEELRKMNLDPEFYLDIVTIASSSYSFYNPDTSNFFKAIFVKDNQGELKEISTISHVVNSLVKNDFENSWAVSINADKSPTEANAIFV